MIQRRRNAQRGASKKHRMTISLPPHLARYIRAIANGSRPKRSMSSVALEIIETAVEGTTANTVETPIEQAG